MAKAASPIRLQANLMKSAELTAKRYHRSTAEQIEYWADIGRQVSAQINPDTLLAITTEQARLRVESIQAAPVDPQQVFDELEQARKAGTLSQSVSTAARRYQVSEEHPGYLDQIDIEGNKTTGTFSNGEFIPLDSTDK